METDLLLIRHGETEWNKKLKFQGHSDVSLNETGFNQAGRLSKRLAEEKIDRIYTSDLKRAANTASIVAEPHKLSINKEKRLREISFGEWEGMNFNQIEEKYPELYKKWQEDPLSVRPPEGETLQEFQQRVIAIMERIAGIHAGERVAVVAHGGTIRVYLSHLLEMPLAKNWKLSVHNTSLSYVKMYNNSPSLKLFNSTYHLEGKK